MSTSDKSGEQQTISGIAKALRQCLVSGLVLLEAEGEQAIMTPEAAAMLGLPGHTCPASVLPAALLALVRETKASGKPSAARQIVLGHGGPSARLVSASAMPVPAGQGRFSVAVSLAQLTALQHCEEHLQHLDRLANTGKLAASTAHEIRNALVAGKTFIELLLEKNRDAELTEVVARELGRIDALVNRLLRFPGSEQRVTAPVHLHHVLDYSLRLIQPQLSGKAIKLERSFRAPSDLTQGDESALQQTFVNLFLNALEAMSAQGKLVLGTEVLPAAGADGAWSKLRVTIQDTGAGITSENLQHLFEPFFTTKPGGTGLGLAIARQIIQEHGGTISVASVPGQGTTFSVLLPSAAN